MPSDNNGARGVTCADCYFRQELLCALKSQVPCPTFRATVGRARRAPATMAVPVQAPLVPMPVHVRPDDMPVVLPAAIADEVTAPTVAAANAAPFGTGSSEATFTLRDAVADAAYAAPRVPLRAAAAGRSGGDTLVVEVADAPEHQLTALEPELVPVRVAQPGLSSRVAQRIASRYPGVRPG
jgi:hypothetical protein